MVSTRGQQLQLTPAGRAGSGHAPRVWALLPGGAHRLTAAIYDTIQAAAHPQHAWTWDCWRGPPDAATANRKSPDRSPVNMRPVRLAPWAAGARPDHEDGGSRVTKSGHGSAPVDLVGEASHSLMGDLLPPLHEPRTGPTGDDGADQISQAASVGGASVTRWQGWHPGRRPRRQPRARRPGSRWRGRAPRATHGIEAACHASGRVTGGKRLEPVLERFLDHELRGLPLIPASGGPHGGRLEPRGQGRDPITGGERPDGHGERAPHHGRDTRGTVGRQAQLTGHAADSGTSCPRVEHAHDGTRGGGTHQVTQTGPERPAHEGGPSGSIAARPMPPDAPSRLVRGPVSW